MNSSNYATREFWDNRFKTQEKSYDWYVGWKEIKNKFIPLLDSNDKILMVGCGNSKLSESIYNDNYLDITNIDISNVVIDQMNEIYKEKYKEMSFLEMDATNMDFSDNSFDMVIDKGTLDALVCAKNDEIPKKLIKEMFRVTKKNKYFTIITYGDPDMRLRMFLEALPSYSYELACHKIGLSLLTNFVNILRNNSKDFTICSAVKDKKVLYLSFIDVCISQLQSKKERILNGESINDDLDNIDKKIKHLKIQKILLHAQQQKKNKNNLSEKEKSNEEDNQQNLDLKENDKDKIESNIKNEENNQISDKDQLEENLQEKSKNDKLTKTKKQDYCFLYIFKKKI